MAVQVGTQTAFSHVRRVRGSSMTTTMLRLLTLTLLVLLPGGLVVLAAYMLTRAIARQMQLEQGTGSHRFARAVSAVSFRDVWSHTRQTFSAMPAALKAS